MKPAPHAGVSRARSSHEELDDHDLGDHRGALTDRPAIAIDSRTPVRCISIGHEFALFWSLAGATARFHAAPIGSSAKKRTMEGVMLIPFDSTQVRARFTPIDQWSEIRSLLFISMMAAAVCGLSLLAVSAIWS